MRKWSIAVFLLMSCVISQAQSNIFFGHYMFNPSYLNPAWVGSQQQAFVALQHRTQWLAYSSSFDPSGGAPSTQMFTGVVPVRNFIFSSLGINISNDNLGPQNNIQLQLPLSYSISLKRGMLNLGIAPGFLNQVQNFNILRPNEPDPLISGGREVQTKMNLSSGLFYSSNDDWFVGVGVINLLRPGFDFGQVGLNNKQEISTSLLGGFSFSLNNGLKVTPNVLVRSNFKNFTFDLGGILTISNKMWGGLSYRKNESVILYLGYNLLEENKLKVGYSFDYVFQNQNAKAPTTHEFFLKYALPDLVFGGRKSVKTPRFSY